MYSQPAPRFLAVTNVRGVCVQGSHELIQTVTEVASAVDAANVVTARLDADVPGSGGFVCEAMHYAGQPAKFGRLHGSFTRGTRDVIALDKGARGLLTLMMEVK